MVSNLTITKKRGNHKAFETEENHISLQQPSVVQLKAYRSQLHALVRQGDNLIVQMNDGQQLQFDNFFVEDSKHVHSDLILKDEDQKEAWWHAETPDAAHPTLEGPDIGYSQVDTIKPLLIYHDNGLLVPLLAGLLAAGAGGGAAAALTGGHSHKDDNSTLNDPSVSSITTNPVTGDVSVQGIAQLGSSVDITFPDGTTSKVVADSKTGIYRATSSTPQESGHIKIVDSDSENPNISSRIVNEDYSTSAPSVAISNNSEAATAHGAVIYTFILSEAAKDFNADSVHVTGGTKGDLVQDSTNPLIYHMVVTPDANNMGTLSVSIPAGSIHDLAGDPSSTDVNNTISYDTILSTIAITSDADGTTATGPVTYSFTVSEPLDGFTADDVMVSGGTKGDLVQDANNPLVYHMVITPDADKGGSLVATIPAGAVHDRAGNPISADSSASVPYDTTPAGNPSVTVTSSHDDMTDATDQPVTYSFTLSEPVSDFTADDVTVSGGTKGDLVQDATNPLVYHMVVTPDANSTGALSATVLAGSLHDMAGNPSSTIEDPHQVNFDTQPLTVAITSDADGKTATGPVTYSFTVSEPLDGFTADDVMVSGGTKGDLVQDSTNPLVYHMVITPDADKGGSLVATIPAGAVHDRAGNPISADSSASVPYDTTPAGNPSVTVTSSHDDMTDATDQPVTYSFTLSEPVSDFTADDVTVSGGTKGDLVQDATNPLVYHMVVTPDANSTGVLSATVLAGSLHDMAGNPSSTIEDPHQVNFDTQPLTVAITNDADGKTATGPVTYSFTVSEPLDGFTADDVMVSGGTKGDLVQDSTNPLVYHMVITPDADKGGSLVATIPAGAVHDRAGNPISADSSASVPYDTTPAGNPSVTVTSSHDDMTDATDQPVTYSFTLSEPVSDFTADDVTVSGGTKGDLVQDATNPLVYHMVVTPDANSTGALSATVLAGSLHDMAGNSSSTIEDPHQVNFDTQPLTVAITNDADGTATGPVTYSFTASEPLDGFTADDVMVSGGTKGDLVQDANNPLVYHMVITPDADKGGSLVATIPAGAVHDRAGNPISADSSASVPYDTTPAGNPSVTVTSSHDDMTDATDQPVTYSFTLSEPVSDFTADDVTVSGGTKGDLVQDATNPLVYHMVVTPDANSTGALSATVLAGSLHDMAGNPSSTIEDPHQVNFDTQPLTVAITSDADGKTATGPVTYSFTASEPLDGFTVDDVMVSGGTKGDLVQDSTNPLVYHMVVTPDADKGGSLVATIPAGAVHDRAGNPISADSSASVPYDTTPAGNPSVTVTSSHDDMTDATDQPVTYSFTLSEPVSDFTADDVTVSGGTKGDLVQDATNPLVYHMVVTPDANSTGALSATVLAGSLHDMAGNPSSTIEDPHQVNFDTQPLTVAITSDADGKTATGPVTYSFTASEPLDGFTVDDVMVSGGTKGDLVQDSTNPLVYHMVVTPDADKGGSLVATIPAGAVHDRAGNPISADSSASVPYDTTPAGNPSVTVTSSHDDMTDATDQPVTYSFTLSEPVSDFTADDVTVSGGTKGDLVQDATNPLVYHMVVTPDANSTGALSATVLAGSLHDMAGNPSSTIEDPHQVNFDTQPLTVAITSDADGKTATSPVLYTFTLSKISNNFTADDVTVNGGTKGNLVQDANNPLVYTMRVTPDEDKGGQLIASVAAGAFQDNAGNSTVSDISDIVSYDTTPSGAPSIKITDDSDGKTATGPVTYSFTASEPLNSFTADNVTVSGGTKGNLVQDPDNPLVYHMTVTPDAGIGGTLTVTVPASAIQDKANNPSTSDVTDTVAYDATPAGNPVITVTSDADGTTATGPVTYSFTASEPLNGFTADDVTVSGGTKGDLVQDSTNPLVYHMIVTPNAGVGGNLIVTVPAGAVQDEANNPSASDTQDRVAYDTTPAGNPVITVTSDADGTTATGPVTYTFTLSEPVNDFTSDDVMVMGGSKGELVQDSTNPLVYRMVITPTADKGGSLTATVPAGLVHDLANNPTEAEAKDKVAYDTTPAGAPTVAITSNSEGETATGPITYSFTLSEPVAAFTANDITVSGGSKGDLVQDSSNPLVYTMVVTPTTDKGGQVTATISAGTIQDMAGNASTTDATNTVTYDTTPAGAPTVAISSDYDGTTATGPFTYSFTLSEPVKSFTTDNVKVAGGTKSDLVQDSSNPLVYHMTVTPSKGVGGQLSATVAAGAIQDMAGNPSTTDVTDTVTYDTTPADSPTITITSDSDGKTATGPVTYSFTASEPLNSFTADNVTVSGGTKGNLVQDPDNPLVYHMTVTPDVGIGGTLTVTVPASAIQDKANNPSTSDVTDTVAYDATPVGNPVITVTSDADGTTATGPVTYSFTASEPLNGFTADDVTVSGGTKGDLVQDSTNPLVYHMTVTPNAGVGGNLIVTVPAGAVQDEANNPSASDTQDRVAYDTTPAGNPVITVTSDADGTTATGPVTYTFTLSEPVNDFTSDDVMVMGGSKGELVQDSTNPLVYRMVITPTADKGGSLTATVPAGLVHDLANNPTEAEAKDKVAYDTTPAGAPTVAITSNSEGETATGPITYSFTLSEPVAAFTANDITVSGGSKGDLVQDSSNPLVYTMVVTPTTDKGGQVTATISAGTIQDMAGNASTTDATNTVTYDTTPAGAPTVAISSDYDGTTATGPFTYSFTLSEPVKSFTTDNVKVAGGTKSDLVQDSSNPLVYHMTVTPSKGVGGQLSATVAAGAIQDMAGNPSTTDVTDTVTYDTTPAGSPTITITSDSDGKTATGPVTYSFTASEPLNSFTADNVTVSGGTKGNLVQDPDNPLVYHMTVTPDAGIGGTLTVTVPASAIQDKANNPSTSDVTDTVAYDATPAGNPVITVTSDADGTTATGPVTYSFTASEPLNGFTADDVTVSGGTKGDLVQDSTNPLVYHMIVTPNAGVGGNLIVTVPAGAVQDEANNPSASDAQDRVAYDTTPAGNPVITVTSDADGTTATGPVTYTFTLSEPVNDFTSDDVMVMGGSKGELVQDSTNPLVYRMVITPTADKGGSLTATVPAGLVHDLANNPTEAEAKDKVAYDTTPAGAPTVAITSNSEGETATGPITYSFTLSEPVAAFTANDITVSGGSKGDLVQDSSNPLVYTMVVTPTTDKGGQVTATISAGTIQDMAGNASTTDATNTVTYDTTPAGAPTVAISSDYDGTTATGPFTYSFTLSEPVKSFTTDNVKVAGGTKSDLVQDSSNPLVYHMTVTPSKGVGGQLSATVAAGAIQDMAGNPSTTDVTDTVTYDTTPADSPTITITSDSDGKTATGPVTYSFTASEPLNSFTADNVTVSGGTKGNLVQDPDNPLVYHMTVTPDAGIGGTLTVTMPAGVIQDKANNPSTSDVTDTVAYDATPAGNPVITVTSDADGTTATGPVTYSFTASEPLNGFTADDVTVSGGTKGDLVQDSTNPLVYHMIVTPNAGVGGNLIVTVPAGAVQDEANNPSASDTQDRVAYDTTPAGNPVITVTSDADGTTATGPVTYTFTLSEPVNDFTSDDVMVMGGSKGELVQDSTNPLVYRMVITPTADKGGSLTATVPAGLVHDLANNPTEAEAKDKVAYDTTPAGAPTVAITSNSEGETATGPITYSFTLSEPVAAFTANDITVSGGSKGDLVQDSSNPLVYTMVVTPTTDKGGQVTATISAGTIQDMAGNASTTDATNTVTYDTTPAGAPTVAISSDYDGTTATGPFTYSFTLSEPVKSFTTDNVKVAGGTKSDLVQDSSNPLVYHMTVTPSKGVGGQLSATVAAGAIQDMAGNPSTTDVTDTVTYDTTPAGSPTITITSDSDGKTATGPVTYSFTASEPLNSFTADNVTVSGGTKGNLVQDPDNPLVYHMTVTPDAGIGGTLTVTVPASAIQDKANNPSTSDVTDTVAYDATPAGNPVITVTSDADGTTATGPVTYSFTASEPLNGFTADDVTVSGGTKGDLVQDSTNPLVYHMTVTPNAGVGGNLIVTVPAGAVQDEANNPSASDTKDRVAYDTTPAGNPVITVTSDADGTTATGPVTYTFTLSEPVNDFTSDDVMVMGGSKGELVQDSTNPLVYRMVITPTADKGGSLTATVPAGLVHDLANNPTEAEAKDKVAYDTTPAGAPTVAITSNSEGETATGPITYSFTLSEPVAAFTANDITVSGGSKGDLVQDSSNPLVYTMVVTPTTDKGGQVTATISAGTIQDMAGNASTTDATNTVTYDTTPAGAPTVAISSDYDGTTATGPFTYSFTLSEPVKSFTTDNVKVAGGTKSDLVQDSSNPLVYHMTVTPSKGVGGQLSATVAAGAIQDMAGNPSTTDVTDTVTYDTTPAGSPTITITSDSDGKTATGPVTYSFTASEPLNSFTADNVTVSGGTKGNLVQDPDNPLVYHMTVTPDVGIGGTLTVTVPASAIQDKANNPSTSDVTDTVAYDATPVGNPVITVTSDADGTTATGPVTYSFTASEPLNGFTADDVTVSGGTKGDLVQDSTNPLVYHMTVTPNAGVGGNLIVTVPAGAVQDEANNPSASDTQDRVAYDTTPAGNPVITVTSDADGTTATGPVTYTFTLSEPVNDFTSDDVMVMGGSKGELVQDSTNPLVYRMVITPTADKGGSLTATVPAGLVHDLANNPTEAEAKDKVAYDTTPAGAPTVAITSNSEGETATGPITYSFTLSEPVAAFTANDITVSGGSKGDLVQDSSNPLVYTMVVTPTTDKGGQVTATISAGTIQDMAGNASTTDATNTVTYDTTPAGAPTVAISSDYDGTTATGPFTYSFTLSEPVKSFTTDNVKVAGGTKSDLVQDSSNPLVYHMTVTPSKGVGGQLSATVAAGAIQDMAGNPSTTDVTDTVTYDTTPAGSPTITITSDSDGKTATGPVTYSFTASEPLNSFTADNVTVSGGTKGNLVQDPDNPLVYHMTVTPDAGIGGTLTVTVPASAIQDKANNPSTSDVTDTVAYDATPAGNPVITVTSDADGTTATGPVTYSFTASEPLNGFTADDVTVSGGTKGDLVQDSTNPLVYHMIVTPNAGVGGNLIVTVPAGAVQDEANNPSASDAQDRVAYDTTPAGNPVITVTSDADGTTATGPVTYTFTLSEPVNDFTSDDVMVMGGSKGELVQDSTNPLVYRMVITPTADKGGSLTATVPAGLVHDLANNPTEAEAKDKVAYDTTPAGAPTVAITSNSEGETATGPITYSFTLSEPVAAFTANDITVSGGSKGDLVQDSSNPLVYTMVVTPTTDKGGQVTATISAGTIQDMAGNASTTDATNTVTYDTTPAGAPTVAISSDYDGTTATGPFTYSFTLSEPVKSFTTDNVKVAGGTKSDLVQDSSNPLVYHMTVTPSKGVGGQLSATVAAGAIQDMAGNPSTTDVTDTVTYDTTPAGSPTITITSDSDGKTATGPVTYSFTASEPLNSFTADNVTVSGGTKGNLVQDPDNPLVYHMTVTPDAGIGGTLTVTVPASAIQDKANNPSTSDVTDTVAYDATPAGNPVITVTSDADGTTATGPVTYSFTASEPLNGFTADDVTVSGGTKGDLVQDSTNPLVYHMIVTPNAGVGGNLIVTVPAGVVQDEANNPSASDTQDRVAYDTTPAGNPVITVTSDADGTTATGPVTYTFTLSEPVNDFTSDDVMVMGGSKGELVQDSTNPLVYRMVITPTADKGGSLTATVPAGLVHDLANNPTEAEAKDKVAYDTTPAGAPTVAITSNSEGETATGPITYSFTLSEPVAAFTANDITVSGGSKGDLVQDSSNPLVYTMVVTPTTDKGGQVTATISAGTIQDMAGNASTTDATNTVTYDTTPAGAPTVAISSDYDGTTATGPFTYSFTLSEPVKSFTTDNVKVAGGTKSDLVQDSSNLLVYHMTVTPSKGVGGQLSATVAAGAIQDMAGNPSTTDVTDTVTYDTTPAGSPTITITSDHNSSVTNDPVTYSFTLSEPVSDFTADDVVVSGGTKGNLVQDSTNPLIYHMTVTPLANQNGTITATIAAGAIHDMAGNASTTEVTASNIFDTAAPTVTVTSNSDAVTANGPVTYTFTASEPLEIFTADKIKVSGGTKGELVQDSTNPLVYTMVVTPDASSEGNLTVSIPAGAVQDVAGNPTAAASGDTVAYDTIIPAIVITSDSDGSVASGAVNYTFTASEALNNFTDDDVTVTGGTKGNLVQDSSDPLIYHMTVTPDSDTQGSMTVTVPAGKVADTGGNTTAVDSSDSVSYNTLPPTANITSDHVGVTATGDIIYTASFNWFVSDFTVKNLEVTNGTIRSITEVSNGIFGLAGNSYQIVVTPESDNAGTTTLSISPGITGLLGTLSGSVDFDTRQLSLQDYTDTGLSSSDHISQDNTYTLSLDNAAKGSTPTYQLSTDNGVTWTNTTAAQNAVPDGHYLYRSVTEGIDGTLISNNSIAITVDTTKPDLISVNPTNGQTVSGVGEAGATINILSNDKATVLGTTTADSSNHWSISGLNIANNTPIKVTATDVAGNVSSAVTTRVDATPPAVTVNASNGDTLSGTSEAGSVIKVDVNGDGTPDYTQTVGVDGQWLIRPDTALANGTAISVTSTDPVGNVSSAVSTTVDNVIPTVTLATTDNQTLTGTVNNSTVTSVTVTDQAGNIIGTADVTNGNYSLTLPSILPEGTSLTATATDAATNVGMSSPLNIVYDRDQDTSLSEHEASISRIDTDTLPTSAVSTTQDNDFTTRDTDLVVAGGSLLASGDILQISTDGSTWTDITSTIGTKGNWAWKDPATHNSSFTYYIRTVDSSGNVLYTATKDVTIDITAPITPKLTVVDGGLNVLNTEAGTVYAIIDDTNRDGVYEQGVDTVISTSDGTSGSVFFGKMYSLGVVQYDTAGNYSRLSSTLAYEIPPDTALNTAFQATVAPPQEARDTAGMSVGFDSSGNLTVLQRSSMITQTTATSYALTDVQQLPYFVRYQGQSSSDRSTINATTQVDYNRDGYSDVVASDYINANTLGIAVWTGSLSGYSLTRVGDSTNSVGGVMAYDKEGDGYVDFVLGNWGAADGSSNGVFVKNTQGVLSEDGNDGLAGLTNLQLEREVSGVDLKGDGNIDIAAHTISNSLSTNQYALALIQNNGGTLSLGQNIDNVFDTRGTALGTSGQAALPTMWNAQSMVWADFANNGQMDLYLSQGNNTPTGSTYDDSRVYMNNNGVLNATPTIIADDNIYGGAATAVDWNHDGKMDVIEIRTTVNTDVQNIPITLLTNNGLDANGNLNPFTATNMTTVAKANITGIAAVDVNWDGAVDLLYSTTSGSDTQADGTGTPIQANVYSIENTNTVDDGTSLHLKILDQNGINSYFGNTVQLFDSTGHLVSTQIINPQEGVWDNDSTAIVNFYNLDPTQHYSVALVRATDGQSNDIGGQSSYSGTGVASALDTIENIEQSWNNLTPGAANHGYVLEGDTTTTHTIGGTFTGTGYNDTFFAGPGNNTYIGGGGWGNDSSGDYAWMSAGGNNIVDYSSETAGITANMGNAVGIGDVSVNKSDGSNDTLKGIQGIIGTQYDDTFNNDGKGDYFVGGGGDDTYNLSKGGHDTLMYKLLSDSDNTGGNGSDTVNDFHLGNITTDANADVINIKDLLADYQGTANVYYDVTDNKYVLDKASSGLDQFVNVSVNNGNTTVSVDRDGTNGSHEMTSLVTLNNTQTDLATLIGNHQLIIA